MAVARQWLSSSHMGIQRDANAAVDAATEEWCLLCGQGRHVMSRVVGTVSWLLDSRQPVRM
jgi:hypothetical protein